MAIWNTLFPPTFNNTSAANTITSNTTTAVGSLYGSNYINQTPSLPKYFSDDPLKQAIYEALREENHYNYSIHATVQKIYRKIVEKTLMEMWDVEGMIPAESAEEKATRQQAQLALQAQAQLSQQLAGVTTAYTTAGYANTSLLTTNTI